MVIKIRKGLGDHDFPSTICVVDTEDKYEDLRRYMEMSLGIFYTKNAAYWIIGRDWYGEFYKGADLFGYKVEVLE